MQTGVGAVLGLLLGSIFFRLMPHAQPHLEGYLQSSSTSSKNFIMTVKLSIAFAGFIVIYAREIKSFVRKLKVKIKQV
jgi:hypothetical protein